MRFVAKTLYGLEKVLAEELIGMGAEKYADGKPGSLFKAS